MKTIARPLSAGSCIFLVLLFSFAFSARGQSPEAAPCCRSALHITADRSVELLVTSPNGLDTGFEPTVPGSFVSQIPSSNYYLGFIGNASGGSGGERAVRKLDIGTPAAGRYLVQAIGASSGKFTIKFTASDEKGATSSREFSGATSPGRTFVYFVHYSPAPGAGFAVTALAPFAGFSADVHVAAVRPPSFRASAHLALAAGSPGFDPIAQPVSFKLTGYAVTIPPGSFARNQRGNYSYEGTIEGIRLKAQIMPEGERKFAFQLEVQGIDLRAAINPIRILLILGENAGAISVNAVSP